MRKSLNAIVLMLTILTASVVPSYAADSTPAQQGSAAGIVNINTADAAQFALLPRIGEKAGARIVEYRKANGGSFKKTTDLMQVKGIGEKTFELIRPYLAVEGKTTLASKVSTGRKNRSAKARSEARGASAE